MPRSALSTGGEAPKSLPSSAILERVPRSSAAGEGEPGPPPCRGSRGAPSRLLRQRQVRGPSPAPTCGALKLPKNQRNPPGRRQGRAGQDGKAAGLREGSKFHLSRPGGMVPPRVSPPRKRCGLAEPELPFPGAASSSDPAEPERSEPRSAPGIAGDEPSGAALRLRFWDFFVVVVISFLFSSSQHSFSSNAPEQRERGARGDAERGGSASPPGTAPGRGPAFPQNRRPGLLLEGGLDFQPVSLLGETLRWGTTLYLFFFFFPLHFLFFFLAF